MKRDIPNYIMSQLWSGEKEQSSKFWNKVDLERKKRVKRVQKKEISCGDVTLQQVVLPLTQRLKRVGDSGYLCFTPIELASL